jgi:4-carboxymuconolactone decarboxylase
MTPDSQHDTDSPESLRRREHGLEVLARIDGHAGRAVIADRT